MVGDDAKDVLIEQQAREIARLTATIQRTTAEDLPGRLLQVRNRLAMPQNEFADHIGVSARAYRNYELGHRELSLEAFAKIVVKCDLDAEWLLFGAAGKAAWVST